MFKYDCNITKAYENHITTQETSFQGSGKWAEFLSKANEEDNIKIISEELSKELAEIE